MLAASPSKGNKPSQQKKKRTPKKKDSLAFPINTTIDDKNDYPKSPETARKLVESSNTVTSPTSPSKYVDPTESALKFNADAAAVAAGVTLPSSPPIAGADRIFVAVRVRSLPDRSAYNEEVVAAAGTAVDKDALALQKKMQKTMVVSALDTRVVVHDPRVVMAPNAREVIMSDLTELTKKQKSQSTLLSPRKAMQQQQQQMQQLMQQNQYGNRGSYEMDSVVLSMSAQQANEMPFFKYGDFLSGDDVVGHGTQQAVYDSTAKDAVTAAMEGMNACVFGYGQTGSGKTYTLFGGDTSCLTGFEPGIIPRALEDLFLRLESKKVAAAEAEVAAARGPSCSVEKDEDNDDDEEEDEEQDEDDEQSWLLRSPRTPSHKQGKKTVTSPPPNPLSPNATSNLPCLYDYEVRLGFLEIYQKDVTCLLSKKSNLPVREGKDGSPFVDGLTLKTVRSAREAISLVELGLRRRHTGETKMNHRSSRSHAIVQVFLRQVSSAGVGRETSELSSVLNLVDLAGSERQKMARADAQGTKEGKSINLSLTSLAKVISEVAHANSSSSGASSTFINYRDSKLTHLLKESIGGNCRTFMIATVSPSAECYQETLATLKYATNVRCIRNKPTANRTLQVRAELRDEVACLKKELEEARKKAEYYVSVNEQQRLSHVQQLLVLQKQLQELAQQQPPQQDDQFHSSPPHDGARTAGVSEEGVMEHSPPVYSRGTAVLTEADAAAINSKNNEHSPLAVDAGESSAAVSFRGNTSEPLILAATTITTTLMQRDGVCDDADVDDDALTPVGAPEKTHTTAVHYFNVKKSNKARSCSRAGSPLAVPTTVTVGSLVFERLPGVVSSTGSPSATDASYWALLQAPAADAETRTDDAGQTVTVIRDTTAGTMTTTTTSVWVNNVHEPLDAQSRVKLLHGTVLRVETTRRHLTLATGAATECFEVQLLHFLDPFLSTTACAPELHMPRSMSRRTASPLQFTPQHRIRSVRSEHKNGTAENMTSPQIESAAKFRRCNDAPLFSASRVDDTPTGAFSQPRLDSEEQDRRQNSNDNNTGSREDIPELQQTVNQIPRNSNNNNKERKSRSPLCCYPTTSSLVRPDGTVDCVVLDQLERDTSKLMDKMARDGQALEYYQKKEMLLHNDPINLNSNNKLHRMNMSSQQYSMVDQRRNTERSSGGPVPVAVESIEVMDMNVFNRDSSPLVAPVLALHNQMSIAADDNNNNNNSHSKNTSAVSVPATLQALPGRYSHAESSTGAPTVRLSDTATEVAPHIRPSPLRGELPIGTSSATTSAMRAFSTEHDREAATPSTRDSGVDCIIYSTGGEIDGGNAKAARSQARLLARLDHCMKELEKTTAQLWASKDEVRTLQETIVTLQCEMAQLAEAGNDNRGAAVETDTKATSPFMPEAEKTNATCTDKKDAITEEVDPASGAGSPCPRRPGRNEVIISSMSPLRRKELQRELMTIAGDDNASDAASRAVSAARALSQYNVDSINKRLDDARRITELEFINATLKDSEASLKKTIQGLNLVIEDLSSEAEQQAAQTSALVDRNSDLYCALMDTEARLDAAEARIAVLLEVEEEEEAEAEQRLLLGDKKEESEVTESKTNTDTDVTQEEEADSRASSMTGTRRVVERVVDGLMVRLDALKRHCALWRRRALKAELLPLLVRATTDNDAEKDNDEATEQKQRFTTHSSSRNDSDNEEETNNDKFMRPPSIQAHVTSLLKALANSHKLTSAPHSNNSQSHPSTGENEALTSALAEMDAALEELQQDHVAQSEEVVSLRGQLVEARSEVERRKQELKELKGILEAQEAANNTTFSAITVDAATGGATADDRTSTAGTMTTPVMTAATGCQASVDGVETTTEDIEAFVSNPQTCNTATTSAGSPNSKKYNKNNNSAASPTRVENGISSPARRALQVHGVASAFAANRRAAAAESTSVRVLTERLNRAIADLNTARANESSLSKQLALALRGGSNTQSKTQSAATGNKNGSNSSANNKGVTLAEIRRQLRDRMTQLEMSERERAVLRAEVHSLLSGITYVLNQRQEAEEAQQKQPQEGQQQEPHATKQQTEKQAVLPYAYLAQSDAARDMLRSLMARIEAVVVGSTGLGEELHANNALSSRALLPLSQQMMGSVAVRDPEHLSAIRLGMHLLFDQLKTILVSTLRSPLQRLNTICSTVAHNCDAAFQTYYLELRSLVAEIATVAHNNNRKDESAGAGPFELSGPPAVGSRWNVSDDDIIFRVIQKDHRRRTAAHALLGLVVWHDHYDQYSSKKDQIAYAELVRNGDIIIKMATAATTAVLQPVSALTVPAVAASAATAPVTMFFGSGGGCASPVQDPQTATIIQQAKKKLQRLAGKQFKGDASTNSASSPLKSKRTGTGAASPVASPKRLAASPKGKHGSVASPKRQVHRAVAPAGTATTTTTVSSVTPAKSTDQQKKEQQSSQPFFVSPKSPLVIVNDDEDNSAPTSPTHPSQQQQQSSQPFALKYDRAFLEAAGVELDFLVPYSAAAAVVESNSQVSEQQEDGTVTTPVDKVLEALMNTSGAEESTTTPTSEEKQQRSKKLFLPLPNQQQHQATSKGNNNNYEEECRTDTSFAGSDSACSGRLAPTPEANSEVNTSVAESNNNTTTDESATTPTPSGPPSTASSRRHSLILTSPRKFANNIIIGSTRSVGLRGTWQGCPVAPPVAVPRQAPKVPRVGEGATTPKGRANTSTRSSGANTPTNRARTNSAKRSTTPRCRKAVTVATPLHRADMELLSELDRRTSASKEQRQRSSSMHLEATVLGMSNNNNNNNNTCNDENQATSHSPFTRATRTVGPSPLQKRHINENTASLFSPVAKNPNSSFSSKSPLPLTSSTTYNNNTRAAAREIESVRKALTAAATTRTPTRLAASSSHVQQVELRSHSSNNNNNNNRLQGGYGASASTLRKKF